MIKRLKALMESENAVRIVSLMLIAGLLLRSPLLVVLSCGVWLYYLYHAANRAGGTMERVVYAVLGGTALAILLAEAASLVRHFIRP